MKPKFPEEDLNVYSVELEGLIKVRYIIEVTAEKEEDAKANAAELAPTTSDLWDVVEHCEVTGIHAVSVEKL